MHSTDGTREENFDAAQNPRKTCAVDGLADDEDYIHPDAALFFTKLPWSRRIPIFGEAVRGYGPRAVFSLGLSYLFLKGVADQLIVYARQPMFMVRFGVDGERYQRLSGVSTMGWSVKALTAMLCDGFAFLGYTKRWYMFASCVGGSLFALGYGLLPAREASANIAAAFVFLCSFGKANVDILSEGHYSRLLRLHPKPGPALVSWIWIFIMIGAIIAAAIQGPLSDQGRQEVGVLISASLQCITCLFYLFNWYGERKNSVERAADAALLYEELQRERVALGLLPVGVSKCVHAREAEEMDAVPPNMSRENVSRAPRKTQSGECFSDEETLQGSAQPHGEDFHDELHSDALTIEDDDEDANDYMPYDVSPPTPCLFGLFEMNKEVIFRNWPIFVYSLVMTAAVVTMACGSILADTLGLLIICVIVSTVCCATSFWSLPLVIAKANIFGFLHMVVYLQLPGALDSFFLADAACLPDGPHFSYTFYNTVGAIIGNIGGLAGVAAFNYIFSQHSYRMSSCITTAVQIVASVFDIIIVKRWNLRVGIPDHAMYICGDSIVYQVCYMLAWMPMMVLLSRLCPRGSESVVYALMAGFSNLGQTTSTSIGSIIMEYGWSITTSPPCDFSNVPRLVLLGHILLPLLVLPLTLLLPNARICDNIDIDGKTIKDAVAREVVAVGVREEDTFSRTSLEMYAGGAPDQNMKYDHR